MTPRHLLDVADCIFAVEQSVRRARETVEDLREFTRSALRILDESEMDASPTGTTKSDLDGHHLEAAADQLTRLTNRCTTMDDVSVELIERLDRAASTLEHAGTLIDELSGDIDAEMAQSVTQTVAQLRPRLAAVSDMVEVARPMSQTLRQNITAARTASHAVTSAALADRHHDDAQRLGHSARTAGQHLHRADEDAMLSEAVIDRAGVAVRQAARVAGDLADLARRLPGAQQPWSPGAPASHGLTGPGR